MHIISTLRGETSSLRLNLKHHLKTSERWTVKFNGPLYLRNIHIFLAIENEFNYPINLIPYKFSEL